MHSDTEPKTHTRAGREFRQVFSTNSFNLILHCDDGLTVIVMRLYTTGTRIREIGRFEPPAERYTCTPTEAITNAAKTVLKHLNDNYSWDNPIMKRVRQDAQPFLNYSLRVGVDLREYPNL